MFFFGLLAGMLIAGALGAAAACFLLNLVEDVERCQGWDDFEYE